MVQGYSGCHEIPCLFGAGKFPNMFAVSLGIIQTQNPITFKPHSLNPFRQSGNYVAYIPPAAALRTLCILPHSVLYGLYEPYNLYNH
jgi:hypothetical protein